MGRRKRKIDKKKRKAKQNKIIIINLRTTKWESSPLPGRPDGALELRVQLAHPVVGHLQLELAYLQHVAHLGTLVLALVDARGRVRQHLLARRIERRLLAQPLLGQVHHFLCGRMHRLGLVEVERTLLRLFRELPRADEKVSRHTFICFNLSSFLFLLYF